MMRMFETTRTDNFSKSIRVGRISKCSCIYTDPRSGKQYVRFSLAVNKDREKADFFEYIAYNVKARYIEHYAPVGAKVLILGTDKQSGYTDKNGIKHKTLESVCEQIYLYDDPQTAKILSIVEQLTA